LLNICLTDAVENLPENEISEQFKSWRNAQSFNAIASVKNNFPEETQKHF